MSSGVQAVRENRSRPAERLSLNSLIVVYLVLHGAIAASIPITVSLTWSFQSDLIYLSFVLGALLLMDVVAQFRYQTPLFQTPQQIYVVEDFPLAGSSPRRTESAR